MRVVDVFVFVRRIQWVKSSTLFIRSQSAAAAVFPTPVSCRRPIDPTDGSACYFFYHKRGGASAGRRERTSPRRAYDVKSKTVFRENNLKTGHYDDRCSNRWGGGGRQSSANGSLHAGTRGDGERYLDRPFVKICTVTYVYNYLKICVYEKRRIFGFF